MADMTDRERAEEFASEVSLGRLWCPDCGEGDDECGCEPSVIDRKRAGLTEDVELQFTVVRADERERCARWLEARAALIQKWADECEGSAEEWDRLDVASTMHKDTAAAFRAMSTEPSAAQPDTKGGA